MPRITSSINLPSEANIKDEELKQIVKQYNTILRQLVTVLFGDIQDHENRIKELEVE